MKTEALTRQTLRLTPSEGESCWFDARYQRSAQLAERVRPPWWSAAPLARLWHGRWRLARLDGEPDARPLELTARSSTEQLVVVELKRGDELFIDVGCLVALGRATDEPGAPMRTWLAGVTRPAFWMWGHPLPCVARGPATLVLGGERLRHRRDDETTFDPDQVAAISARGEARLVPMTPRGPLARLLHAAAFYNRLEVGEGGEVVLMDVQRPRGVSVWWLNQLLRGLFVSIALLAMALALRSALGG